MSRASPTLSIRVADECFEDYILNCEFTFMVTGYAHVQIGVPVAQWVVAPVEPYLKNYGIDSEEFCRYREGGGGTVLVAWLNDEPVGHVVVSQHWNGYAHIDELAVDTAARRHGIGRKLLDVAQFWSRKHQLPGIVLETQNNNLAACRLYESYGFVVGGLDYLRYRAIEPTSAETAIFWYLLFEDPIAG